VFYNAAQYQAFKHILDGLLCHCLLHMLQLLTVLFTSVAY